MGDDDNKQNILLITIRQCYLQITVKLDEKQTTTLLNTGVFITNRT